MNIDNNLKKILFFSFFVINFVIFHVKSFAKELIVSSVATTPNSINILSTIKPLYNLVAAITKDVDNVTNSLLLRGNFSPHHYNLKFSDIKSLDNANLIIWVGKQLEFFLVKPLSQDEFNNKLLTIQDLPSLTKLNFRNSKYLDEHLWLYPDNAKIIVAAIEKKLSLLDPINATKYSQNKKDFLIKLSEIDKKIKTKLNSFSSKKYLVFHDAYQYFEKAYNLQQPIVMNNNPSNSLSFKRILFIHDLIINEDIHCLFKEPQFNSKALNSLLTSKDLNGKLEIGILDPLGSDQDLGANGYISLLNNLAKEFYSCFNR